jgi:hypothetical protein
MTKTLNQIIFFSSTKIRIFFSATLGIRIFVLEKNHNPLQVKWSFPNSSTAIRPIRCFLCIMHMQWSSKGIQMRRSSFRNESESGGGGVIWS